MEVAASGEQDDRRAPTVLVVEDEVLIRMALAETLRERDLNVLEAANADEALAMLECMAPIDLIFTDVRMSGPIDGLGLAQTIRVKRPSLKIIVASGHLASPPPPDLADAFFLKPYVLAAVAARVLDLLADPAP